MHTSIYIYIYIHVYTYLYIYIYTHIHNSFLCRSSTSTSPPLVPLMICCSSFGCGRLGYISLYIYIYIYIYMYKCVYIYIYVHTYVYIYIYEHNIHIMYNTSYCSSLGCGQMGSTFIGAAANAINYCFLTDWD